VASNEFIKNVLFYVLRHYMNVLLRVSVTLLCLFIIFSVITLKQACKRDLFSYLLRIKELVIFSGVPLQ